MQISKKELLCSGILNAIGWGLPMGLFTLNLAFDHPGKRQKVITYIASAAIFCVLGSTIHFAITNVYQNQDTHTIFTAKRSACVIATSLLTPLAAMSLITLSTLNIRSARQKSISVIKQCTKPRTLIAFAISALATHIIFTQIFSDNGTQTSLCSKKTLTRISTSSLISGSAIFFAACFSIL